MKFAIRKLTITCVLPATFFSGLAASEVSAQQVPSAVSKATSGMPTRTTAKPKQVNKPASIPLEATQKTTTVLVRQNSNPSPQTQSAASGESDVQRQLRLLYEKSGQDMPAMNLDDLEVPEPQQGTAPNQQPGPNAGHQGGQNYGTPAPQPKAPNFFERVFLGKKTPPPMTQRPPMQRPQMPAAQPRPPQYNPAQPEAQQRPSYRPYQAGQSNQQAPFNQPAGQQPQLGTYGQRPGQAQPVQTQPGTYATQPQGTYRPPQAQPQPQSQQFAQPQTQARQQPQAQPQAQPQTTFQNQPGAAAGTGQTFLPAKTPNKPSNDDLPVLADEPEESMEIDLTPKTSTPPIAAPAASNANVPAVPATKSTAPVAEPTEPTEPAHTDAAEPEQNPFSGLKLMVPETPPAKPKNSATGTLKSPAANAARTVIPAPQPNLKSEPATETPTATRSPSNASTLPRIDKPAVRAVQVPADTTSPRSNRSTTSFTGNKGTKGPAIVVSPASNPVSDYLKKLADAPEKNGLKGFCCVALRQQRQLLETKPQFHATHENQKYFFSSLAAQTAFEKTPDVFVPARQGKDAVALVDDDETVPGSLDYAAWYQGKLFLFATREHLDQFKDSPDEYVNEDDEDLTTLTGGPSAVVKTASPVSKVAGQATSEPAATTTHRTAAPKKPAAFDDIPVLSENLDDLEPITPPADIPVLQPKPQATQVAKPLAPAAKLPVKEEFEPPVVLPVPQSEAAPQPSAVTAPSTVTAPGTVATPTTPRTAVKSATNTVAPKKAPPKLISPDLRLVPAKDASN